MTLKGKTAIVTGGSSGIGRAAALRLAEDGAAVVIADIREDPREGGGATHEVIRERGGRAHFVATDVANVAAVEACVRAALTEFGGLHIAFCAAAVVPPVGSSLTVSPKDFDRHFDVNVRGAFLCAQAALRHFAAAKYGRLIFTASSSGLVGVAETAAYCASKAAVIGLARSLAAEFGPLGITVNALCPGATQTEMGLEYRSRPGVLDELRAMTPLRLPGDTFIANPEDIANAVRFLASDEARFMTGSCLVVDGGRTTV